MLSNEILKDARELIGSRLREKREERSLTREQLAERVGCATSTISRIEAGKFFPAMDQLLSILHELNCYIYFDVNESESGVVERLRQTLK